MKNVHFKRGIGPLVIVIIVAIILAIGGGVYYNSKKADTGAELNTQVSGDVQSTTSASAETSNVSLRELLAGGKNLICTFSSATTSGSVSGTVYLNGSMMAGDFTMTSKSSGSIESHMIKNGDIVYAWTGSQGAKMSMSALSANSGAKGETKTDVNLDQKSNYNCKNWSADSSKFTTPTGVNFVDLSAMMNTKVKAGASGTVSSQCSACAALPAGAQKTQCLSAMHC